jgi:hypothetical protein
MIAIVVVTTVMVGRIIGKVVLQSTRPWALRDR